MSEPMSERERIERALLLTTPRAQGQVPPQPTSADVRAAMEQLWWLAKEVGGDRDRAALALLTERVARLEAALVKYGADHVEGECAKWAQADRGFGWTWLQEKDCTCGLAALLPPATEGR